jgi:hypothetical protein
MNSVSIYSVSATEASVGRHQGSYTTLDRSDAAIFKRVDLNAHIKDGNEIVERHAVQDRSAPLIVRTAKNDIAFTQPRKD